MARRLGLKDVHIAKVTKNDASTYTAETPEKLFKAINAKVVVKRTSEKIYSDDEVEDIITALDGIEVELEGSGLTMKMIADTLGCTLNNGMLIDNKDDQAVEVALGWRARRSNNKYEFVWLYCGKFDGDDEESYETQGEKPSPKSKSLKGTFYARSKDGNFRVRVHEDELLESNADAKAALTSWFTEVAEPLSATPTSLKASK